MKVEVREFVRRGAQGDRDRSGGVEYSDYKIALVNDQGAETILQEFAGYDSFGVRPFDQRTVRKAAETYAAEKATFFGAIVEHHVYRLKPPRPQAEEWEEVGS